MLKLLLEILFRGDDLTREQAQVAASFIINHPIDPQAAALLTLLHAKGECADEILGFRDVLIRDMIPINSALPALDIVGTGGDGKHSVNISTAASLLVAAVGIPVIKHGNRSVSSRCGSADVLEALGFNIDMHKQQIIHSYKRTRFAFCYAANFHPSFMQLKNLRKCLNFPTIFNLLGPLLNPANADYLMLGVNDKRLVPIYAKVLQQMPIKRAFVYHGFGYDEITTIGPIQILDVTAEYSYEFTLDPQALGFVQATEQDLQGGDKQQNAIKIRHVFQAIESPLADTILLNSALALTLFGATSTLAEGVKLCRQTLKLGLVEQFLHRSIFLSQQLGEATCKKAC